MGKYIRGPTITTTSDTRIVFDLTRDHSFKCKYATMKRLHWVKAVSTTHFPPYEMDVQTPERTRNRAPDTHEL